MGDGYSKNNFNFKMLYEGQGSKDKIILKNF